MKYKVICTTTLDGLEDVVTRLLSNGWQLQGGISVVLIRENETEIRLHYYQALTIPKQKIIPERAKGERKKSRRWGSLGQRANPGTTSEKAAKIGIPYPARPSHRNFLLAIWLGSAIISLSAWPRRSVGDA